MVSTRKLIEHYDSLYRFYENEGDVSMAEWSKDIKAGYEASLKDKGDKIDG